MDTTTPDATGARSTRPVMRVRRLNHAVLFVRDLDRSIYFYEQAFGFGVIARDARMRAAFLRAAGTDGAAAGGDNHHDLGLFEVGREAPRSPQGATGLFHLAWQVDTIDDLAAARDVLSGLNALSGESSHGATKSIYGVDPDGNQFEIMWLLPRDAWGDHDRAAPVDPLDLAAEVDRWSGTPT